MNLRHTSLAFTAGAALLTTLLTSCGGGSGGGGNTPATLGAQLVRVEYGRLVDIYAYQRVDATKADRRDTPNRVARIVARNVVVRPDIETQSLFEVTGDERTTSNYRFLPFDVNIGHEELLILWDNTIPGERDKFDSALLRAKAGLPAVSAAFREQNTAVRPIPVVPRNAALKLVFDRELQVGSSFFTANPNAIQILEFITRNGAEAYRPVPTRIMADEASREIVVDTSLIGGEARGGRNTPGLPPSDDSVSANLRIALPTAGVVSKQLKVAADVIAELNGVDARGDSAVIRDFRSGNLADGQVGALADVDNPMVVGQFGMGIIDIDTTNRVITVNKRFANAAIRGRIPFVDGAISAKTDLPGGPGAVPTTEALRSGDVVTQQVISPSGEIVTIRAEVVMNMDVGNFEGDPNFPTIGMAADGSDGGTATTARLKLDTLEATDSFGNVVTFETSTLPLGKDCQVKVHYYENVAYTPSAGSAVVSDRSRIAYFVVIDPEPPLLDETTRQPVPRGTRVDPHASLSLRFSEPLDILSVKPQINFLLTNETIPESDILTMLEQPKPAGLGIIAAKRLDESGDGTLWRLDPPMGHFHVNAKEEAYWLHMVLDTSRVADLAGRQVDVFDRRSNPSGTFSVQYTLEKAAETNAVGYRIFRFESQDEDGTAPGSIDFFGQFQLRQGRLSAAPVTRFNRVADPQILSAITRFDRGECSVPGTGNPPGPPSYAPFAAIPGILYQCPRELGIQPGPPQSFTPPNGPQPGGGIKEPHQPRGSRLQMTYREDDFGLSYTDPAEMLIDIEQMHWAPWNDGPVRYDVFDRYTLRISHGDYRPDLGFIVDAAGLCNLDPFSLNSGLQVTFLQNVLQGSPQETLVKDKQYILSPNNAFRSTTDVMYLPYPKFAKSYTWRDPRHVTWDMQNNSAVGLGGAHQANADIAVRDTTVSISSPWVPDKPPANIAALHQTGDYVWDHGDFLGFRNRDHDPIAMPLLMDFSIFPDDPKNKVAKGSNLFFVALVGPCWSPPNPGGYYNPNYPAFRVHANGGRDPISNKDVLVDPANTSQATRSFIKDIFLGDPTRGIFQSFPNDDHLHWAQADFVRRVSMVTFGFWDTLQPNRHDFGQLNTTWKGKALPNGVPNLVALPKGDQMGIEDFVTIMDPPLAEQPQGTNVTIEFRGADKFDNNTKIFDQDADDNYTTVNIVQQRGNLLNPHYACEAYRYAGANEFPTAFFNFSPMPAQGPRVKAEGLTPYVLEEKLDGLRHPVSKLLPRYMNFRVIFENNLDVTPPLSPFLRSFAVAYRVSLGQ